MNCVIAVEKSKVISNTYLVACQVGCECNMYFVNDIACTNVYNQYHFNKKYTNRSIKQIS